MNLYIHICLTFFFSFFFLPRTPLIRLLFEEAVCSSPSGRLISCTAGSGTGHQGIVAVVWEISVDKKEKKSNEEDRTAHTPTYKSL